MTGVGVSQRSRKGIAGRRNSVDQVLGAGELCSVSRELYAIGVGVLSTGDWEAGWGVGVAGGRNR